MLMVLPKKKGVMADTIKSVSDFVKSLALMCLSIDLYLHIEAIYFL